MNDESFDLLFQKHFISLDPVHITFPLVTTEITEPRLALRQICSVNYSTSYSKPVVQQYKINNIPLS